MREGTPDTLSSGTWCNVCKGKCYNGRITVHSQAVTGKPGARIPTCKWQEVPGEANSDCAAGGRGDSPEEPTADQGDGEAARRVQDSDHSAFVCS